MNNDKERQNSEWRADVFFNEKYDAFWLQTEEMYSRYAKLWDGYLGLMTVTKQRISYSKDTFPIHFHTYRARLFWRQIDRNENEKMIKDNVAVPITT